MALAMKNDEASNPVAVRLLGTDAVVLEPDPVADPVEQGNRRLSLHGTEPFGPLFEQHSRDFEELSPGLR
jgi:hypothetical protein